MDWMDWMVCMICCVALASFVFGSIMLLAEWRREMIRILDDIGKELQAMVKGDDDESNI